jgi:predicted DNA-binding transcriptional regulator AlpA
MADLSNASAGLPAEGYVRLKQILAPVGPIPVRKSTWWAGVKAGRFPRSYHLGPGITAWRVEDIRALIVKISRDETGGA